MANILDILTRAQALRQETALNSITPDRAGGIMYDTLILINQMQLEGGSLLISKVYSSVAAMEADTTPTSDLTGRALRPGQLAVIVPSSSSSSDMGSVYRYNEPGSWTLCGKIGGLPLDTAPIQGSTNGITSGAVYNALSALRNEGYKYMGIATPGSGGTAPGTPNQPVFYVAAAGSYPNFGNLTVASGHLGFLKYSNGSWTVESIEVGKDYDEEISQLEAELHQLAGKFYGVFADDSDLPEGDAVGYAFVGTENPYAIWNFDGEDWSDSGSVANGITGEPGVGFASIFTPTPYDGTVIIVLSNNDTITLDLNHNHPAYYSKVLGGAQPVGGFEPDVVYSLGTLSGTITFSLASPVTGNVNHYFWMFDTDSTAPTITWPAGLTWAAGSAPTVAASKHYEVSILGGIAYYSEV